LKEKTGSAAIHTGATSQDVIDTALTFTMLASVDLLKDRVSTLINALGTLNDRFGDAPLMGRTRMQAAQEITVTDRLSTWRLPHFHHRDRLNDMTPRLSHLSIGGAAGNRGAITPDGVAEMERLLDMPAGSKAWHAMRDGVGEFASVLTGITGSCGKMGQDIALMAQQGLDEVSVAGGGGSSAMPHKQNPIKAELLVTLARFNATQLSGIQQAMVHEQERSGAAWALEWMILPQMAQATGRALNVSIELCSQIERMGTKV